LKKQAMIWLSVIILLLCACAQSIDIEDSGAQAQQTTQPSEGQNPTSSEQQGYAEATSGEETAAPEETSSESGASKDSPVGTANPETVSGKTPENPETNDVSGGAASASGTYITLSVKKHDGTYLIEREDVTFTEGESVLDILIRVGKEKKIPVVYSGSKKNGYVEGIGGLFEFDEGPESGWVYGVNGARPGKSSGSYTVCDKDVVEWEYILKIEDGLAQR